VDAEGPRHARSNLRVLFLINSLDSGGAERRLVDTVPLLRERGASVAVGVLQGGGGLGGELAAAGLPPMSLDGPGGRIGCVRRLRAVIRDLRPDVIHTTLFASDVVGRAAALLERVPTVSSLVIASFGPDLAAEPGVARATLRKVQLVDATTARMVRRFHPVSQSVADVAAR
jgi:hypothetical protein